MGIYCNIYIIHKDGTIEDVNYNHEIESNICVKNNAYMIDELESVLAPEFKAKRKVVADGKEYDVFPVDSALVLSRMIYSLREYCTSDTKPYGFKYHIETLAYRHEFGEYKE